MMKQYPHDSRLIPERYILPLSYGSRIKADGLGSGGACAIRSLFVVHIVSVYNNWS